MCVVVVVRVISVAEPVEVSVATMMMSFFLPTGPPTNKQTIKLVSVQASRQTSRQTSKQPRLVSTCLFCDCCFFVLLLFVD